MNASQYELRGQLEQAHWAAGFRPRQLAGLHNDLIHPAEMMIRAFHFWQQARWPGGSGRTRYAHTLFNVYGVRCLELLSMRIWDQDEAGAGARLAQVQSLLDDLWRSSPVDQPAMVRDARWLIPLAQSLPTDELAAYLEVARQVTETLSEADTLEVQRAHVRMLGAHLTSQIRHYCTRDAVALDHPSVVERTRTSNALDFALLIQGLVALLAAYERARHANDEGARFVLAGAIFQGISPDPELFLNRIELLAAYSVMEHVFIAPNAGLDGRAAYTPLGERHTRLLGEYRALIQRLTEHLFEDLPRFRPAEGDFSAYGVVFGTPSALTELIAFKALLRESESRFSFEDAFDERDASAAKLAWLDGLRKMPHIPAEVQRQYDYPHQFAAEIFARIDVELQRRVAAIAAPVDAGRLRVAIGDSNAAAVPDVPARFLRTSDKRLAEATGVELCEQAQLLHEREEGHFLVSYQTPGGWIGLKKALLAEMLAETQETGRQARIGGLPHEAAQVLQLACLDLVIVETGDS